MTLATWSVSEQCQEMWIHDILIGNEETDNENNAAGHI